MSCDCHDASKGQQKSVLVTLLSINATMFVVELFAGLVADSTGLIADSLDMLADALVYGLSLYAVGRSPLDKIRAARWSGVFQIILAFGVAADILRRMLLGSDPESFYMYVVGAVAFVANIICLKLIYRHREGQVHMRASWIFSKNDVIANLGVIAAGIIVHFTGSLWPDLLIGMFITIIVFRGGLEILEDCRKERLQS